MLLPGGYSVAEAYRSDTTKGNAIGAFAAALRAAHFFEERGDYRNAGVWHREVYYANYLYRNPSSKPQSQLDLVSDSRLAKWDWNCFSRPRERYSD